MAIILNTSNNKRDYVKASVTTNTMQAIKNKPIKIDKIVVYDKVEKDETVIVSCVHEAGGEWFSSISPSVYNSLEVIADAMVDELGDGKEGVEIVVKGSTAKSGREFLYLDLV